MSAPLGLIPHPHHLKYTVVEEACRAVLMWINWVARAPGKHRSFLRLLLGLGPLGLFGLALVDSLPLPTFSGADILTAILAATHRTTWYEYAAAATAGSFLGAILTFRLARKAGLPYLNKRFGESRVSTVSGVLEHWGTLALAISAGVPFPTPTTVFLAAAGASGYSMRKYLLVVGIARAVRFSLVAFLAARYGRVFLRAVRHPAEAWGWLLLLAAVVAAVVAGVTLLNRRIASTSSAKS